MFNVKKLHGGIATPSKQEASVGDVTCMFDGIT